MFAKRWRLFLNKFYAVPGKTIIDLAMLMPGPATLMQQFSFQKLMFIVGFNLLMGTKKPLLQGACVLTVLGKYLI